MARSRSESGLNLAQLEKLMQTRRAEVLRLTRVRDKLQKKLSDVEAKLEIISGANASGKAPRRRFAGQCGALRPLSRPVESAALEDPRA